MISNKIEILLIQNSLHIPIYSNMYKLNNLISDSINNITLKEPTVYAINDLIIIYDTKKCAVYSYITFTLNLVYQLDVPQFITEPVKILEYILDKISSFTEIRYTNKDIIFDKDIIKNIRYRKGKDFFIVYKYNNIIKTMGVLQEDCIISSIKDNDYLTQLNLSLYNYKKAIVIPDRNYKKFSLIGIELNKIMESSFLGIYDIRVDDYSDIINTSTDLINVKGTYNDVNYKACTCVIDKGEKIYLLNGIFIAKLNNSNKLNIIDIRLQKGLLTVIYDCYIMEEILLGDDKIEQISQYIRGEEN